MISMVMTIHQLLVISLRGDKGPEYKSTVHLRALQVQGTNFFLIERSSWLRKYVDLYSGANSLSRCEMSFSKYTQTSLTEVIFGMWGWDSGEVGHGTFNPTSFHTSCYIYTFSFFYIYTFLKHELKYKFLFKSHE